MNVETIKRRIRRVQTEVRGRFARAYVYDVFMLPGGKVMAVLNPGDNYQEDNNAVWMDLIIYTPGTADEIPPPREKDVTAEYQDGSTNLYERGLLKWRTDRLSAEVTARN